MKKPCTHPDAVAQIPDQQVCLKKIWLYVSCLAMLLVVALSFSASAQIRLVADLNTNETEEYFGNRFFSMHQSVGHRSFYVTDGNELWTTDGTAAGTVALKSFFFIKELKVSGDLAFFSAHTYEHGYELWKSDGTVDGTVLVKDIYPGSGDGSPSSLTDVNGMLYFSVNNSANGRELWKSDGTPEGTVMVKDIKPGPASSNVQNIVAFNSSILFSADDGVSGYELWISNGSGSGTSLVIDIFPGNISSGPGKIAVANGTAYFAASAPVTDRQLWKSDGTAAGTFLVKAIRPDGRNAKINKLAATGSLVFFEADDGVHGLELWKSDGTNAGTMLMKDITPGTGSTSLEHLTGINGKLFFTATTDGYDIDLYVSDGTPAGTTAIASGQLNFYFIDDPGFAEFNGGALFQTMEVGTNQNNLYFSDGNTVTLTKQGITPTSASNPQFQEINNTIVFFGGETLYQTDITETGTIAIKKLNRKGSSDPRLLTDASGALFFALTKDEPTALYKTDGTPEGTVKLKEVSLLNEIGSLGNSVYFTGAGAGSGGYRPWTSNGTPEGTIPLSSEATIARYFSPSNGVMFFNARGPLGEELWRTDGTPGGTVIVKDINIGSGGSFPSDLTDVNNILFFTAYLPSTGSELWKSDGTPGGTMLVKEIQSGAASGGINNLISFKNKLYFLADDGVHGLELWTSNGTAAGTYMVTDQNEAIELNYFSGPAIVTSGNSIYFITVNSSRQASLWKSNGDVSGAVKLKEFDLPIGDMLRIIGKNDKGVFIARRVGPNFELWRTWGTTGTTVRVKTFRNHGYYEDSKAAVLNNVLYFGTGQSVWRSDGNGTGTYQLQPFVGESFDFTSSGSYVYFNGESIDYGYELFLIDESTSSTASQLGGTLNETTFGLTENLSGYPNPFRNDLTVRVNGSFDETFELNVMATNGEQIFKRRELSCNVDHSIGTSWKPGLYILRVKHNNKVTAKKVIKVSN
jgi:ELWxxDGT repeat protein